MTYSARQIADYLLFISKGDDTMTPMKLLKLVYICHGCSLGVGNGPLIKERIVAWKYGPVVPSVYTDFKQFKTNRITNIPDKEPVGMLDDDKDLLNEVYNAYKHLDGLQLSTLANKKGSPWSITWEKQINSHEEIDLTVPDEVIKDYYTKLHKN